MHSLLVLSLLLFVKASIFDIYDLNKDGYLDELEVKFAGCSMVPPQRFSACVDAISKTELSTFFEKLLESNSSKISKADFSKFFQQKPTPIEGYPQQVHLATTNNPSEMVVMWVTRDKEKATALYGTTSGKYQLNAVGTISTYNVGIDGWYGWIYTVTLTQLKSNTKYFYVVGQADNLSDEFSFTTPPVQGDSTFTKSSFAVVADMGTVIPFGWAVTDRIYDDNQQNPFQMVIHAGDVCYAGTGHELELEEVWDAWGDQTQKVAANVPWMFAVGNHEKYYNYTSFTSRYLMPGKQSLGNGNFWWSMDYGITHFTFMSTEHDYKEGSEQWNWLNADLTKANRNPQTKWRIVIGHRPMYCSDVDEWNDHHPGSPFQTQIEPLFVKYNIDLYLCGHMHMYERTYPVINGKIKSKGPVFQNPGAPIHVDQATAGVFLDDDFVTPQPEWSAKRDNKWGYGKMDINQTHIHYTFVRLWEDKTGDEFWIQK